MATSGSTNYSSNRDDLIAEAFLKIGVGNEGETLAADYISKATRTLNYMIKAWSSYGLQLWKREETTVTLVASTNSYTIGLPSENKPLKILDVSRVASDNTSTDLTPLSRQEWDSLPNETTEGTPTSYYYEPGLTTGVLYTWLTPNTSAASEYTLKVVAISYMENMDSSGNDFDFPVEWLEALAYGLAVRLAPMYHLPLMERYQLRKEAKDALDLVLGFDNEDASLYIQPDHEMS